MVGGDRRRLSVDVRRASADTNRCPFATGSGGQLSLSGTGGKASREATRSKVEVLSLLKPELL